MEIILKKDWDEAQQWQRDSAIKGVEFKLDNLMQGTTRNTMLGLMIVTAGCMAKKR
jgi:hypothetical protein